MSYHVANICDASELSRSFKEPYDTGIYQVVGFTEQGHSKLQAFEFNADLFTPARAIAWMIVNGYGGSINFKAAGDLVPIKEVNP